jgi:hypothetical protein
MFTDRRSYKLTEWSLNLSETPCGPLNFQSPIEVTHGLSTMRTFQYNCRIGEIGGINCL